MSPVLQNILLIFGSTVGAGIFSLPVTVHKAGLFPFMVFMILLSILTAYVNLLYREIVEHTPGKHQLPGYAKLILGDQASHFTVFFILSSICGSLLAFLILGGTFLGNLTGISSDAGSMIFFSVVFLLVYFDGKHLEKIDMIMSIVKMVFLLVLVMISVTTLTSGKAFAIPFMGERPFYAYGSTLFALSGFTIIPELRRNKYMKKSIFSAQIGISLLYVFFGICLFPLLSGNQLMFTEDWKRYVFDIAGVSAVFTPYLLMTWVGYDIFSKDLHFSKRASLILILCIPLILFLSGLQSFSSILSLTGGVFLGGIAILISKMYREKFPSKHVIANLVIQIIFLGGVIYEIYKFMFG